MKKHILLTIILIQFTVNAFSQLIDDPTTINWFNLNGTGVNDGIFDSPDVNLNCHREVNSVDTYDQIQRAAIRIRMESGGNCSATLVNRNTSDTQLGAYFMTAWHCFKSGSICDGDDEPNDGSLMTIIFNYQSPPDNLGRTRRAAINVPGGATTQSSPYFLQRRVRLVSRVACALGDFALFEILGDPIPFYFNPYYAGWQPNTLTPNTLAAQRPLTVIHHPSGSTKRYTVPGLLEPVQTPLPPICNTVTTVVDVLFGWIWGNSVSTNVICQYVQIPYLDNRYTFINFNRGSLEGGSSGSGLMSKNFRVLGTYSGGSENCNLGFFSFGKLSTYYSRRSIKNALNPSNKLSVDLYGIPGREITCYQNINLNDPGVVFPAREYQRNNLTSYSAANNIHLAPTGGGLVIQAGVEMNLNAGQNITLENVTINDGATVNLQSGVSCTPKTSGYRLASQQSYNEEEMYEREAFEALTTSLQAMELPYENFTFNASEEINGKFTKIDAEVSPNPSLGEAVVSIKAKTGQSISLKMYNILGDVVFEDIVNMSEDHLSYELSNQNLKNGVYLIQLENEFHIKTLKFIKH